MGYITKLAHTTHNCLATPKSPIRVGEDLDPGTVWVCEGDEHMPDCETEWMKVWEPARPYPFWRPLAAPEVVAAEQQEVQLGSLHVLAGGLAA